MLPFVSLGLCAASLLFNIIGLALPHWVKIGEGHYGLWSTCVGSTCQIWPVVTGRLQAVRAMEILGMLVIAGALVCVVLKQFVMKDTAIIPKAGGGCGVAAGILMILGTVIFATSSDVVASTLNAGFALCIIAGLIGIAAGIVTFLAFRPTGE